MPGAGGANRSRSDGIEIDHLSIRPFAMSAITASASALSAVQTQLPLLPTRNHGCSLRGSGPMRKP
jgi:hypothetical protein